MSEIWVKATLGGTSVSVGPLPEDAAHVAKAIWERIHSVLVQAVLLDRIDNAD